MQEFAEHTGHLVQFGTAMNDKSDITLKNDPNYRLTRFLGRNATFEFYGTKGSFKLEAGRGWIALEGDKEFRELEVASERQGGWRVEQEFVEAIRDGKPVTHTSFEDGVKYMEFTEAVQLSLRAGRRIDLPL